MLRCPGTSLTLNRIWIRCATGTDGMSISWMSKAAVPTVIAHARMPTYGADNWSTVMLTSQNPVDTNEVELQIDGPPDGTCELVDLNLDPRH